MQSINPFTNKLVNTYQDHTASEVRQIIREVAEAWQSWRKTSPEERAGYLLNLERQLLNDQEPLAAGMVGEMGKVKREALGEIKKCAWVCRYYAENGAGFLQNEPVIADAGESYVSFQPLGTILAIMPWNFPFWQVFRFLAPALMAGNTAVLKHAGNVAGCSLAIEQTVKKAGLPENVFRSPIPACHSAESRKAGMGGNSLFSGSENLSILKPWWSNKPTGKTTALSCRS